MAQSTCPPIRPWPRPACCAALWLALAAALAACGNDAPVSQPEEDGSAGPPAATTSGGPADASIEAAPTDAEASDAGGCETGPCPPVSDAAPVVSDARAPSDANGQTDAADAADAEAGPRPPPASPADLCELEPSQVLVIGDSLFAMDPSLTGDTQPFGDNLEDLAREAGALDPEAHYRDHSRSYATLTPSPLLPAIPAQYADARGADPDVQLLVLNGGGNDLLFYYRPCLMHESVEAWAADPSCVASADEVLAAYADLLAMSFEDGVQAAVLVWYPGWQDEVRVFVEYMAPRLQSLCADQVAGQCHFVDLRMPFDVDADGVPDPGMLAADDRHASEQGSRVIATEVWGAMERACAAP